MKWISAGSKHCLVAALATVGALWLHPTDPVLAQGYPFCRSGQVPQYLFGFATLRTQLGRTMGEPMECEHPNSANGDTLQRTTTGLAFYRKATNTPTFTDGWRHWALTPAGLVFWEGTAVDPPARLQLSRRLPLRLRQSIGASHRLGTN